MVAWLCYERKSKFLQGGCRMTSTLPKAPMCLTPKSLVKLSRPSPPLPRRQSGGCLLSWRPESSTNSLFVVWSGKPMSAGGVANALSDEIGHFGVEKRLNCNKIRHLASTLVSCLLSEDDHKDLASLMAHSHATQQKNYNDAHSSQKKVRISKILVKLISGQPVSEEDLKQSSYELPGYDLSKIQIGVEKTSPTEPLREPTTDEPEAPTDEPEALTDEPEALTDEPKALTDDNSFDVEDVCPHIRGAPFPMLEKNFLIQVFHEEVVHSNPTLSGVREKMESNDKLQLCMEKKWGKDDVLKERKLRDLVKKYSKNNEFVKVAKKV